MGEREQDRITWGNKFVTNWSGNMETRQEFDKRQCVFLYLSVKVMMRVLKSGRENKNDVKSG